MKHLVDSSVWLALAVPTHQFHILTISWFKNRAAGDDACFCRSTQQTLLRLLTTRGVMAQYGIPPLTNAQAWNVYEIFQKDSTISNADEPINTTSVWQQFTNRPTPSPKLWMDAYLAAFAVAGGYRLVTTDAGFRQYPGLDLLLLKQ